VENFDWSSVAQPDCTRSVSGLLREEELATVGAAVAAVAAFWSLLALAACAVVRWHNRKRRRQRLRTRAGSDVDAQTAMMDAMIRAELARGRSRVSDSLATFGTLFRQHVTPATSTNISPKTETIFETVLSEQFCDCLCHSPYCTLRFFLQQTVWNVT